MANINLQQIPHTPTGVNAEIGLVGDAQKVSLTTALPAGTNIIGLVKLTDGTNALAINTNGSINIIPVNSAGTELFTVANPGTVNVKQANVQFKVETIANAVSVNPSNQLLLGTVNVENADEVWLLVSIDNQPWTLSTSVGPWTVASITSPNATYPTAINDVNTYTIDLPFRTLKTVRYIAGDVTSYTDALNNRFVGDSFRVLLSNLDAVNMATVTLKALKIWR